MNITLNSSLVNDAGEFTLSPKEDARVYAEWQEHIKSGNDPYDFVTDLIVREDGEDMVYVARHDKPASWCIKATFADLPVLWLEFCRRDLSILKK
jgi:hypothetical protein